MKRKRLSVAVVGCGYWGKNLVRNFAELGALAALVDVSSQSVRTLASKYGAAEASLEDVLRDDRISAVAIATPAKDHFVIAKAAIEAGKHAFVEKPLALNLEQAKELCDLAEEQDRRLMVGHLLQYHPGFLRLRELVQSGRLGRVHYIHSNRLNFGLIRQEEDILWSFAPHDISMILALTEEEPCTVTAVGSFHLQPSVADVTITHLGFLSGVRAHVFVSWLHPFKEQKMVVVGEGGMAVFDDGLPWDEKLVLYPHRTEWRDGTPTAVKAGGEPIELVEREPLRAECEHFLECIETGARPRTDGREGLRVLSVLAKASDALRATNDRIMHNVSKARHRPESEFNFEGVSVHESAYIDPDVEIGQGTRIWHFSHILSHTRIGKNVVIGQNVVIGPQVTIGDRCKIQNNVSVYRGVILESGVFCGPSCVFTNVNNPRAEIERKHEFVQTLVKRGSTIGANATIVCGTVLGEYCFIAAGAVITKNVPAFALMAGVPAKRIGWMSHSGHRLGSDLTCPATGQRYAERGPNELHEIE